MGDERVPTGQPARLLVVRWRADCVFQQLVDDGIEQIVENGTAGCSDRCRTVDLIG